jgi:hypothetical protein
LSELSNPAQTNSASYLLKKAQNQSTPAIRTALGMINNRRMDGRKIVDTFDDDTWGNAWKYTKFAAAELVGLLGTDMLSQIMGGTSERFSNESPEVRKQLNEDVNFLLKVLNKMQMVSIYAQQGIDKQSISQMNRLNRQLLYEIKDKELRGEKYDRAKWINNFKERVDAIEKNRKAKKGN